MPPGGQADVGEEPPPRVVENHLIDGRSVTVTWFDPPFRPEPPNTNQAYGLCFALDGRIVIVGTHNQGVPYWNLPGGGVLEGESLEECLRREVLEEVCAQVLDSQYIGCQRVDEPDHPDGPLRYYQARFWARVNLLSWRPEHETFERRLVKPADFLDSLSWGSAQTAAIILKEGLRLQSDVL